MSGLSPPTDGPTRVQVAGLRASSSGIATFSIELCQALAATGVDVDLVDFGSAGRPSIGYKITPMGPSADRVERFLGPLASYSILSNRLKRARETRPSRLMLTLPPLGLRLERGGFAAVAWGMGGWRQQWARAATSAPLPLVPLAGLAIGAYRLMDVYVLRRAELVTALTASSAAWWGARLGRPVIHLHPPVSAGPHRDRVPGAGGKIRLAFVSRDLWLPRKNLRLALEALDRLDQTELRGLALDLCGAGAASSQLLGLQQRGLEVRLLGALEREQARSLIASSDLLLLPSSYEELGYVALEAIASATPVVASRIPPLVDIVQDAGALIDTSSSDQMADTLRSLVRDPRRLGDWSAAARNLWTNRYEPRRAGEAFAHALGQS